MKSGVRASGNIFQATRVFNAPRPLVFSFWTTAEKYRQWSGCKEAIGCEVVMDFRVGGSFTQKMQVVVDGVEGEFKISGIYEEIVEPERIKYAAHFGTTLVSVTVEFLELGECTKVVVTHEGCPNELFGKSISLGTSESLDKLNPLVSRRVAEATE